MILQNMTPEEKLRQVSRLELDIRSSAMSWVDHNQRTLKKRKAFPFIHVIRRDYDGMGTWNIILTFKERPNFRKGVVFSSNAFQKFYVEKGAKPENIGAGIYLLGANDSFTSGVTLYEFSPHFFYRFRQRYMERNHIEVKNFEEMILLVVETLQHTILCDSLFHFSNVKEKNDFMRSQGVPRLEGYDNLAVFTRHGIVFGLSRKNYECYLTYVDREDFYQGQQEYYGDVVKLYDQHDQLMKKDPYYYMNREAMLQEKRIDFTKMLNYK